MHWDLEKHFEPLKRYVVFFQITDGFVCIPFKYNIHNYIIIMDIPSCQPSSTQQYSPDERKSWAGKTGGAPTDAALVPALSIRSIAP